MALDPAEFQRRRQARQEQRQRRQAQRRKLLIRLGIAAVAVIACTVLILSLSLQGRDKPPAEQPAQTASAGDAAPTGETGATGQTDFTGASASTDTREDTTVIHLAAAGDLNVTQSVVNSAGADYDFTKTFMDVAPILAQADIATVNLEGNFFGTPYGEDRSAPAALAEALSAAGVDLIQLANSYSIYKGMDGLAETVRTVQSAGMEPVGAWPDAKSAREAGGYTIRTVQGIRVAFVAFTKGMNGMALPPGNESCVNLLYTDYATDYQTVDEDGIVRILGAVKRERPDVTVALLHWGSEYNNTVSESQEEICKLLQEQGVDAIIGTHSHFVQKMEYDTEAGTFVAYSLGDFLGDADQAGSEYSVILDLEITRDHKSGDTRITGFDYVPIFTVTGEDIPTRVVRIEAAMRAYNGVYIDRVPESTYDAMENALKRIKARIKGE